MGLNSAFKGLNPAETKVQGVNCTVMNPVASSCSNSTELMVSLSTVSFSRMTLLYEFSDYDNL